MSEEQDNIGSTARDLLANERTYLAWVRTGLGMIGVGVVLAKLVASNPLLAELAGVAFIAWGALIMIYAIRRYRHVTALLERGRYQAATRGPLTLVVAGLIAAAFALALVVV